jgi:SAM-dependent methyltransferase
VNEHWKEHFDHDIAFHRKTAAIYDHVNSEPRLLANDLLFAPLDRQVAAGESMLDLGCGTGQMLLRYGNRFRRRVGVDHSEEMLDLARTRLSGSTAGECTLLKSEFFEFLAAHPDRYSLVTCVGCLHHLPVTAFAVFFRLVRARLAENGQLLLAEPVGTVGRAPPPLVTKWNATSVMATRAALMPMEESHEAPIDEDTLLRQPGSFGFRRVVTSRGWELFQRKIPASLIDHVALRYLHARFGGTGNVVAVLWQAI